LTRADDLSPPRELAPLWFFVCAAGMVALHFLWPIHRWNWGMSRWWGLPFALAGFVLVVGSARRFASRTTLRPDETPSLLVTDGLHRVSRNPMYLGMLIALLGGFVMLGSVSPIVALPLCYWVLRTRFIAYEEQMLESRFGDEYHNYKRRVRRFL
jgi:protein-S-isoprenylcysteine O-methyltransferase Ste14